MSEFRGALEGIRVVDFSHVFQGPVCTQLLADFGADVIKVERPGAGDWSRQWGPFIAGVSMPFVSLNRNKRSIALNLKDERGRQILLKLVETADVLVHNFRPGAMEKLGLGYEDVEALNPRLVYAYSSGWGDEGPYVERGRGGHDMMARATAGLFAPLGPDGLPVPGGISADYPAGLLLGQGILIALLAREKTGKGQFVSTDLLSAAFHAHAWTGASELNQDSVEEEGEIALSEKAIRVSFRTQDGFIEVSPVFSPDALRDISTAMGLENLSADPRFAHARDRLANSAELNAILEERFLQKTTEEWIALLEPQGVLCAEIKTYVEAAGDPQIRANGMVAEMEHAKAGKLRVMGNPIRMRETPASVRREPPELGEQNGEVLEELGYSGEEIAGFLADGVIG